MPVQWPNLFRCGISPECLARKQCKIPPGAVITRATPRTAPHFLFDFSPSATQVAQAGRGCRQRRDDVPPQDAWGGAGQKQRTAPGTKRSTGTCRITGAVGGDGRRGGRSTPTHAVPSPSRGGRTQGCSHHRCLGCSGLVARNRTQRRRHRYHRRLRRHQGGLSLPQLRLSLRSDWWRRLLPRPCGRKAIRLPPGSADHIAVEGHRLSPPVFAAAHAVCQASCELSIRPQECC